MGWRVALAVYPPMLRNKVAIVTGANAGLGRETTQALLQVRPLKRVISLMACHACWAPVGWLVQLTMQDSGMVR